MLCILFDVKTYCLTSFHMFWSYDVLRTECCTFWWHDILIDNTTYLLTLWHNFENVIIFISFFPSWCIYWCFEILFGITTYLWSYSICVYVMTYFITSRHTFWRHNVPFDVMMFLFLTFVTYLLMLWHIEITIYFLMLWNHFWCRDYFSTFRHYSILFLYHDILFDIMTYFWHHHIVAFLML